MRKVLLAVLILAACAVLALRAYLRSYIPDYNHDRTLPGLRSTVTVERNRYGVPTIIADNEDDLYLAWGYVNAQDRLFQMEIARRIARGRVSEFAGEPALSKDIFLRAVGFHRIAEQSLDRLSDRTRRNLERYVEGVNTFVRSQRPPLYFKLLGIRPERWAPSDATAVAMMLNWALAYNMKHELIYQQMAERLGRKRASDLLNLIPPGVPTIVEDRGPASAKLVPDSLIREMGALVGCASASDNWVVAPWRTAHGGTILCSDMHLHGSKLPSDLYLLRIKAGGYEAAGVQVVGLPLLVAGYNRYIAWACTNQGADMVDLFVEKVDWTKKVYRYKGREIPLRARKEVFQVKGQGAVQKTIYYVGRKPIINDVFPGLGDTMSLDWTGFDGIDIDGFFRINRAEDYDSFLAGARGIRMSPLNMVYADRYGNIAYRLVGSLPRRAKGTGNFPQDGEAAQANWTGNIPDDAYPCLNNPERGYIVTANNKVTQAPRYEMNPTYAPGCRYENIVRMIRSRDRVDVAYMKKVQTDTRTLLAARVIPYMERYIRPGSDTRAARALDIVMKWDGRNRKEDAAPAIYNTFLVRFMYQTLKDEIGEETARQYIGARYISLERFLDLLEEDSDFFDDVTTPERETIDEIANRAFQETLGILEAYSGNQDPAQWTWGTFHIIRFDHILGRSRLLAPFVNYGPFAFEGDCETNNRGRFFEIEPPLVAHAASGPRLIVRLGPEPRGYMMLITGENEYFLSPHRTDMTDAWLRHEYFCMEEEKPVYRMILTPGP